MDDELKQLMAQFQRLQKEEGVKKLNERNVVEILQVIRKQLDLVYTTDGKDFLTWPQLEREVLDEVLAQGGRLNVVELPGLLGVDIMHIEKVIPRLTAGNDSDTILLNGEIITRGYLDSVVEDAAQLLKEKGFVPIPHVVKSSGLPTNFVTKMFTDAIQSRKLKAIIDDVGLHTTQFIASQKLLVKSVLLGVTTPTQINQLETRHEGIYRSQFLPLIQLLLDQKELSGRVDGGVFIPGAFDAARFNAVYSYYRSSGYVPYSVVVQQGVSNPKTFLSRFNPPVVEEQGKGSSSGGKRKPKKEKSEKPDALRSSEHVDVNQFPDWGHFLTSCFLSDKLIQALSPNVEQFLARDVPYLDLSEHLPTFVDFNNAADREAIWGRLHQIFSGLQQHHVVNHEVLIHRDIFEDLTPQAEYVAREDLSALPKSALSKRAGQNVSFKKNRSKLGLVLGKAFGAGGGSGATAPSFFDAALDLWIEQLDPLYEKVRAQLASGGFDVKKLRADLEAQVFNLFSELRQYARHLRWIVATPSLQSHVDTFSKQMVSECGPAFLRGVCCLLVMEGPKAFDELSESVEENFSLAEGSPLCKVTFKGFLPSLPSATQGALQKCLDAGSKCKSAQEFVDTFDALSSSGDVPVPLNKMSKKQEREAFDTVLQKWVSKVRAVDNNGAVPLSAVPVASWAKGFEALIVVAIAQAHKVVFPVPGKLTGAAVAVLAEHPLGTKFQELQVQVSQMLKGDTVDMESLTELVDLRKALLSEYA